MGLLNKLFGKRRNEEAPFVIEMTEEGIFINRVEITFPTTMAKMKEIFGEPTKQYWEDDRCRLIWNNYGVSTDYVTPTHIPIVRFLVKRERRIKHLPKTAFKGKILINGTPIEEVQYDTIKVNKNLLHKGRYKGENNDIFSYSLMYNYDYKEEIPKDKYSLPKPTKNGILFSDFNFKLAIIQELMYRQELLKPKFDIYEFAEVYEKRKIDIHKEGFAPIPEVIDYFEKLEIDKKLAEQVTEIYQDGGNDIYFQIIPLDWDGVEPSFDITSCEDIKYFPNLKKMTLFTTNPDIYEELRSKGIDAKQL